MNTLATIKRPRRFPRGLDFKMGRVEMTHGAGGRAMAQLIEEIFVAAFDHPALRRGDDQALLDLGSGRIALTTDSYVVSPLFFPGGDIGSMAVHGTVNDLAVGGAEPRYLTAGFIVEEGFALADLVRIAGSMAAAAREAGVAVVTGDTKVVEAGKGDGVFINTAGVGTVPRGRNLSAERIQPGDAVLLSGCIGDHGVAIMSLRENLSFATDIVSDSASLNGLTAAMLDAVPSIHCMRDPTRGGLAATLNEIAQRGAAGIVIDEDRIPVRPEVHGACELLGLDPLNVANEGKLVALCPAAEADALLDAMRGHPMGRDAAIIGAVVPDDNHFVEMRTSFGGRRMVDWLSGEQLPRIC